VLRSSSGPAIGVETLATMTSKIGAPGPTIA
jgi:hypothetical protein